MKLVDLSAFEELSAEDLATISGGVEFGKSGNSGSVSGSADADGATYRSQGPGGSTTTTVDEQRVRSNGDGVAGPYYIRS